MGRGLTVRFCHILGIDFSLMVFEKKNVWDTEKHLEDPPETRTHQNP